MPIINNTSDIAKLLEKNKASTKFYIGHSLYRAYQKTDTYFGDGQLAMEFVYHGDIATIFNNMSNLQIALYTCRFTNNLPTLFIPSFGSISALYALVYITQRLYDIDMLERYMYSIYFKSPEGFEVICRMLKTYWHYNQYISKSKYGILIERITHDSSLVVYDPSSGTPTSTSDINLVYGGNFVIEFDNQFGDSL